MDKRAFLKNAGLVGLAAPLSLAYLQSAVAAVDGVDSRRVASDEDFWRAVRGDYSIKPDYINLENGYYCFMPQQTLEHQIEHMRRVNYEGSYYMRNSRQETKRLVAGKTRLRHDAQSLRVRRTPIRCSESSGVDSQSPQ